MTCVFEAHSIWLCCPFTNSASRGDLVVPTLKRRWDCPGEVESNGVKTVKAPTQWPELLPLKQNGLIKGGECVLFVLSSLFLCRSVVCFNGLFGSAAIFEAIIIDFKETPLFSSKMTGKGFPYFKIKHNNCIYILIKQSAHVTSKGEIYNTF